MDDGLVPRRNEVCLQWSKVLILVVVDDGLVLVLSLVIGQLWLGLNPCCSGRWSRTTKALCELVIDHYVLILVVVDDGLVRAI